MCYYVMSSGIIPHQRGSAQKTKEKTMIHKFKSPKQLARLKQILDDLTTIVALAESGSLDATIENLPDDIQPHRVGQLQEAVGNIERGVRSARAVFEEILGRSPTNKPDK